MVSVITSPSPTSVLHAASVAKSRAKTKAASSPTELYECAILEQWRREQQRRRMVKWRRQKKDEMTDMLRERQDLEKKVRLRVNEARVASDVISSQSLGGRYQQVFIECTALQNENLSLREAIEKQHNFNTLAQRDTQELLNQFRPEDSPLPPPSDDAGWRVQFPNGSPSFHFTPQKFLISLRRLTIEYATLKKENTFLLLETLDKQHKIEHAAQKRDG
ncbi:hypothetical protein KRP22_006426 [Phytophthora ramorum]|nr:hypothetical protein KRP22_2443 [Phytophthora ramorum]